MTDTTSKLPPRWKRAHRRYDRDCSLLVRGVYEHREAILESYPRLKLPNVGLVGGVCTRCARVVTRPICGFVVAASAARESVEGTPYEFKFVNWRCGFRGIPRSAVAVLRKLGVTELPKPSHGLDEPVSGGAYYSMDGERIA